jgi:ketosteroid isomerase-like protein
MTALSFGFAVVLAGSLFSGAQDAGTSQSASQSKIIALENAWNQAEERKDAKALDALLDNSLVYTDYDGTFKTKADFLAGVKAPGLVPEQQVTESMTATVYGEAAVVTGVYRIRGTNKGKPYLRRGRFTDTWVNRAGNWMCVASQYTLVSR